MRIETIDRFQPELDEVARRSSQATFYHTSLWIQSLSHAFPSLDLRCIVAHDNGDIVGYLPYFVIKKGFVRALWSLPYGTYGGPVTTGDDSVAEALVKAFASTREQRGVHEVGLVDIRNSVAAAGFSSEESTTHFLELKPDFEEVWLKDFDRTKRRQTRRAAKEGLDVVEAKTLQELKSYYRIYEQRVQEWRQPNPHPEALFTRLYEQGNGRVRLFLAFLDDNLLGGHLNFYFKDTVIAWNGVTTRDSRSMQASTLLYSACLRDACKNGYRYYNLGGSLGKRSLMDYKEAIGGKLYRYQTMRWQSMTVKMGRSLRKFLSGR